MNRLIVSCATLTQHAGADGRAESLNLGARERKMCRLRRVWFWKSCLGVSSAGPHGFMGCEVKCAVRVTHWRVRLKTAVKVICLNLRHLEKWL